MHEPNLVILAGGISSRMNAGHGERGGKPRGNTTRTPKSMIGVGRAGRPFIDYVIRNAVMAGYKDITVVVGGGDNPVREHLNMQESERKAAGFDVTVVDQPVPAGRTKPMGTSDALLRALRARTDWRGAWFTVCNSDNLYSVEAFRTLLDSRHDNAMIDYDISALRFDKSRIARFAVIKKDNDGFLTDIVEKPEAVVEKKPVPGTGHTGVSMNIFRFSYDTIFPFLEAVPENIERQEKELPAAVKMMIIEYPRSVFAYPRAEHVPDLTSPEDIAIVRKYIKEKCDYGES